MFTWSSRHHNVKSLVWFLQLIDFRWFPKEIIFISIKLTANHKLQGVLSDLSCHPLQVIWCPVPCTTSSLSTSRAQATARRCTQTTMEPSNGNRRLCTPSATLCTVPRSSGRTLMWSPPRSPCTQKGGSNYSVKNLRNILCIKWKTCCDPDICRLYCTKVER